MDPLNPDKKIKSKIIEVLSLYPNQKLAPREFRELYKKHHQERLSRPEIRTASGEHCYPSFFEYLELFKIDNLVIGKDNFYRQVLFS